MPIKTLREKKLIIVKASGSLTIEQSRELLEGLRKALKGAGKTIELDLSGVTDADISCLQLLCSAQKSAVKIGKALSVTKSAPVLSQAAAEAGFQGHNDCGKESCPACLWGIPVSKGQA